MKLLICVDGPAALHLSQMLPLARCFEEYEISSLVLNPVTFQLLEPIPYINPVPLKVVDKKLVTMSFEDARSQDTDFYYNRSSDYEDVTLGDLQLDSYDKIILLYDGNYFPILKLFRLILDRYKVKCIGRFENWSKECKPQNPQIYRPKDVVESFGFAYKSELLSELIDFSWYKKFDPQIREKNSVCLTLSGGCGTHIPDNKDRTFIRGAFLRDLLINAGFNVVSTNRKEPICRQIFYTQVKYMISVDSAFLWARQYWNSENTFLIQPSLYPNHLSQLGVPILSESSDPNVIFNEFLKKVENPKIIPML